jgi:hypothetical protein
MKKFITTLLILLILGGLGFFFGWAQMGVPPDAYGVIRSKSHGIDPRLVSPGEFWWVWYKLIPTNAQTSIFRIKPVNHAFSARNTLPSGMVYSAFAGLEDTFYWEMNASFSFTLKPEALVQLVSDENISTQEELVQYENDTAEQIEASIQRRMNLGNEYAIYIESLLKYGESPDFEREIQEQFPLISGFSMTVKSAILPDYALYQHVKSLHEGYISAQREYLTQGLGEKAKSRMESQLRFGELEQMGSLLTRFPILLEAPSLVQSIMNKSE